MLIIQAVADMSAEERLHMLNVSLPYLLQSEVGSISTDATGYVNCAKSSNNCVIHSLILLAVILILCLTKLYCC